VRLFAAVALAMALDLVTFALIVPLVGIGVESNGYMVRAYLTFGILGVAAVKVAATAVILVLVARVKRPNGRRLAAGFGIAGGIVGMVGNLSAFIRWQS